MQNENEKDWFSQLNERLDSEPKPSDEEIARRQLERQEVADAMEGTSRESAFMNEDGSIALKYWSYKDGVIGDGWEEIKPGEPTYMQLRERHKLSKPGDANTIIEKWIDEKWVVQEEQRSEKPETGTAKTA